MKDDKIAFTQGLQNNLQSQIDYICKNATQIVRITLSNACNNSTCATNNAQNVQSLANQTQIDKSWKSDHLIEEKNSFTQKKYNKIKITPVQKNFELIFYAEFFTKTQSFHHNFCAKELANFLGGVIGVFFKNVCVELNAETITFLTNKKGKTSVIKKQKNSNAQNLPCQDASTATCTALQVQTGANCSAVQNVQSAQNLQNAHTSQNRTKSYLIKEGAPVPFLVHLGVMTKDGKIVAQKYDKFRQINRFLEYIDDILPTICAQKDDAHKKDISVIDFGCGKSYLTFAVYYYLKQIKHLNPHIVGLDLKQDVILLCNKLAKDFGYTNLCFKTGNIASYADKTDGIDLVITLHACDTATDFALAKAVEWGARAILSVPCCQHELNSALNKSAKQKTLAQNMTLFAKYGIIQERFASLATDAMRGALLEQNGYNVQILEYIDMSHTPKNLLIRAVRKNANVYTTKKCKSANGAQTQNALASLTDALGAHITLEQLLSQN